MGSNMVDVLDHVLDKGIVIDAYVRIAVAGIDLVTVEARVLVASIETYLQHADTVRDAYSEVRLGPVRRVRES